MANSQPMYIQEERPRPADPLATLDDDYEKAVLHLAWDLHKKTKERTLLFGLVELLPREVPPPFEPDEEEDRRIGGKSDHSVSFWRVVLPARQALEWYLDCRRGVAVLPEKPDRERGRKLGLPDLDEHPPWPSLMCASKDEATPPFCPPWQENPRLHHLIPLLEPEILKVWRDSEREKATDWLSDRLHFRLEDYPEYWGSVHLVAPNPLFRDVEMRVPTGRRPSSTSWMRFLSRAGKAVEGLQVTSRPNAWQGPVDVRHIVVKSPLLRLDSEQRVTNVEHEIFDSQRGLLERGNYCFPTGFNLQVNLRTSRLRVPGKTPEESFEVDRVSKSDKAVETRTEQKPTARARMTEAQNRRTRKSRADSRSQRWFSGAKGEATSIVRELIHPAKREVLIVDPYFGPNELPFVLAVRQEGIEIQILTSEQFLDSRDAKNRDTTSTLLANIDLLSANDRLNPLKISVMKGDKSPIHDRFLVVDDRIWLLGSSLNEFGSRGTMLVMLPDPETVRDHLFDARDKAQELRAWVAERKART